MEQFIMPVTYGGQMVELEVAYLDRPGADVHATAHATIAHQEPRPGGRSFRFVTRSVSHTGRGESPSSTRGETESVHRFPVAAATFIEDIEYMAGYHLRELLARTLGIRAWDMADYMNRVHDPVMAAIAGLAGDGFARLQFRQDVPARVLVLPATFREVPRDMVGAIVRDVLVISEDDPAVEELRRQA